MKASMEDFYSEKSVVKCVFKKRRIVRFGFENCLSINNIRWKHVLLLFITIFYSLITWKCQFKKKHIDL